MPIGKNSITKRVATPQAPAKEEKIAPELVATVAAAPKAPAKKTASTTAKKPASSTAKKPAAKSTTTKSATAKKPAATKKETLTPPAEAPKKVDTAVIANIAPETVAAVIGHKENTGFEKVQIGEKMPVHLL